MRRYVLAVAMGCMVAAPTVAQSNAYFPSNQPSGGSTNTFPFGNAFGPNWRYHGLLSAANLPTSKIKITDISVAPSSFSATSGTGFAASQFQIRMDHYAGATLSTVFGSHLGPCPIDLYDGPITMSPVTLSSWNAVGLQTSFGYDGDLVPQPNLVFEIRYQGRSTVSSNPLAGFRSFSDGTASMPRLWSNTGGGTPTAADPYSATYGRYSGTGGIRVCLTYSTTCICDAPATAKLGTTMPIRLIGMTPAQPYQIATSFGQRPIFSLGTCSIALTPDDLFRLSTSGAVPALFGGYAGNVPASGNVTATLSIPAIPVLAGVCIYSAGVGVNPLCCTNTEGTQLTP